MDVLFIHGADGHADDRSIVDVLRAELGVEVAAPRMPDDDMSVTAWRREIDVHRARLGPDLLVVGHSFGASIALLHFGLDRSEPPLGLALLAMPFWGQAGWGVPDYELPADAHVADDLPLLLHHCHDDEVVPVEHVDLHARQLPTARIRLHDTGGHQLDGRIPAIAVDLSALIDHS